MGKIFLRLTFMLIIFCPMLNWAPVGAADRLSPLLSVKLSLIAPVTFRCLGPVTLYYQPEKGLAKKPGLPLSSWAPVASEEINHLLTWQARMMEGRIVFTSEQGDLVTSDLPLMLRSTAGDGFAVNGAHYPGTLVFWPDDDLLCFNEVSLEDYVCGVLGSEAYAGWPLEALKANAVAIRSYTLYSLGKHGLFDLCDDVHCQRYRGLSASPVFREAVQGTAGEVLTWSNRPINAVYHSSSGGRTKNNEEIWAGSPLPYLRSVEDFDQNGKKYHWEQSYRISLEEMAKALGISSEGGIRVTPLLNTAGEQIGFYFAGRHGDKQVNMETLRRLLSLPSANFRMVCFPEGVEIGQTVTLLPGTQLLFVGKGAGHGVGLSQWGAAALATRGYTYRQILHHYYGTEVGWDFTDTVR